MRPKIVYGNQNASLTHARKLSQPAERRVERDTGRIVRLLVGQGYGFIRLVNGREIYFHRADLQERTSFNDFGVGDTVTFELFDDRVSGARALFVRLERRR
jgi:cold shock CspA family protein